MKKEKTTRRKEKGAETKSKLYEIAGHLFEQFDFNDISIDQIVEAAGVSKGTFYVHFESKDALIARFISGYVNKLDMDYQAHLDSMPADTPASAVLLSLIGKITDLLAGEIGYHRMRAVYRVQLTGAANTEVVLDYNRRLYQVFSDVLAKGIQRGEFATDLQLDVVTRHFVMAIRGLCYEWCIRYPDFDLKEQALTHFDILLSGIKNAV